MSEWNAGIVVSVAFQPPAERSDGLFNLELRVVDGQPTETFQLACATEGTRFTFNGSIVLFADLMQRLASCTSSVHATLHPLPNKMDIAL